MASSSLNVSEINLNKICRTCLRQNIELHSIYSNDNSIDNIKFKFILSTVTSLEFKEEDGYPSLICAACIKCAANAFLFKRQSEKAYSTLKNYFDKKKVNYGDMCSNVKEEFMLPEPPVTVKCEFKNVEHGNYLISDYDLCQDSDDDVISLSMTIGNIPNNRKSFDKNKNRFDANSCNICNKIIENIELEIHKKECCKLFSKSTKVESNDEELKCSNNFLCPFCYKYFGSASNLECHSKACDMQVPTKREESKELQSCIMCNEKFNNEDELLNHIDVSHNELVGPRKRGRPSKKDREAKKLRLKTLLDTMKGAKIELTDATIDMDNDKMFIESCTDDVLFNLASNGLDLGQQLQFCTICCNTFSSKQSLDAHMKKHLGTKLLICKICGMMFLKQNDFKRHFMNHNSLDLMPKDNFTSKLDIFPNSKQQIDNQADDTMLNILSEDVLEEKILERNVTDVLDEANIKLELINDSEKLHVKRNHCIHVCAVCGGVFLTSEDLLQHTDNEHGENNYKCKICNKVSIS